MTLPARIGIRERDDDDRQQRVPLLLKALDNSKRFIPVRRPKPLEAPVMRMIFWLMMESPLSAC